MKFPRVVLQSRHRESLVLATKDSHVQTISTAFKNEIEDTIRYEQYFFRSKFGIMIHLSRRHSLISASGTWGVIRSVFDHSNAERLFSR